MSEEISVVLPSGNRCHIDVYGIKERHHVELQQRRCNFPGLAAYLYEQRLLFSINHAFSSLTGRRSAADFTCFYHLVPAVEVRNGALLASCNQAAEAWATRTGKILLGGSDAHTLGTLARVYTEVPQARSCREFVDGLRLGQSRTVGRHGGFRSLTSTVARIGVDVMYDNVWSSGLAPLLVMIPLITGVQCLAEMLFARFWHSRSLDRLLETKLTPTVSWPWPRPSTPSPGRTMPSCAASIAGVRPAGSLGGCSALHAPATVGFGV